MAKSLRSKWKRKCRAVKRVRYGQKEHDRLLKTLGLNKNGEKTTEASEMDVVDIAKVKTVAEIKKSKVEDKNSKTDKEVEEMAVDDGGKFNPKTLRNEHGAYPIWLHPRKIPKKNKKEKKRLKKKKH